jgi:hypothetical protein
VQGPAHGTTVERASLRQRKIAVEVRKGVHLAVAFRNPVKTRSQEIHREKLASCDEACSLPCVEVIEFRSVHASSSQALVCGGRLAIEREGAVAPPLFVYWPAVLIDHLSFTISRFIFRTETGQIGSLPGCSKRPAWQENSVSP